MNKLMKILRGKMKDKKGFTLMEMLIVVAIIAVLVAIAVPTFNSSLKSAKKAADDASIRTAYTEKVLHDSFPEEGDAPTVAADSSGKMVITFADNTTYTLKYYKGIKLEADTGKWVGDSDTASTPTTAASKG